MKASVNTDGQNNSKNINEGVSMSFSSSSSSFSNQILSLYLDRKKEGSTPKASNRKKQSRTRTTRSSNNSSTVKASNRKSVNSNAEGKELTTTTTTTTGRQTEPQKETQTQTQGRRRRKELRMSKIVYRVDGKDGKSATNGKSGRFGFDLSSVHQDGENGTNAGTASSGQHAGTLTIDLVSAKRASDGELVAKICANGYYTAKCSKAKQEQSKVACDQEAKCVEAEFNTVKVYDSKQKKDRFVVPLAEFQGVDWSARGGNGGNGGIGGHGGSGGKGKPGTTATRDTAGTSGCPGGKGGDSGRGSNGKAGGDGGSVKIRLKERDAFLLMKVAGCSPLGGHGGRLNGGLGGKKGRHGMPGRGGAGGEGGASFEYTVRHEKTEVTSSGPVKVIETERVTMCGGCKGAQGPVGRRPDHKLVGGETGRDGRLEICVIGADGSTKSYAARYDLMLSSIEEKKLSSIKSFGQTPTYEFGETVIIPKVNITNAGKMPTPQQRVLISIDKDSKNIIHDNDDHLFLRPNSCLEPLETSVANQGFLRFTTIRPQAGGDDFDPLTLKATRHFKAFQLGPEPKIDRKPASPFVAEYECFDTESTEIRLAYPVENRDGFIGRKILCVGDSTSLSLSLLNTSTKAIGRKSRSKRKLFVKFYWKDDDDNTVDLDGLHLFKTTSDGRISRKPLSIEGNQENKEGHSGHVVHVDDLPAGGEQVITHVLKLSESAKPFTKATLQADIFLQDLTGLRPDLRKIKTSEVSVIQRRKYVVNCQPAFSFNEKSKVVFVTSSSTTRAQYEAWLSLLEDIVGFETETYALPIYGHLNPDLLVSFKSKSKEETAKLRILFEGKLVIILNDLYTPPKSATSESLRPTSLMSMLSEFHRSTRFLVVGSDRPSTQHLSSESSALYLGRDILKRPIAGREFADTTETTADVTESEVDTVSSHSDAPEAAQTLSMFRPEVTKPSPKGSFHVPDYAPGCPTPIEKAQNVYFGAKSSTLAIGVNGNLCTQDTLSVKVKQMAPENSDSGTAASSNSAASLDGVLKDDDSVTDGTFTEDGSLQGAKSLTDNVKVHENVKSFKAWVRDSLRQYRENQYEIDTFDVLLPGLDSIAVQSKFATKPNCQEARKLLLESAERLQTWLKKTDSVRSYVIEIHSAPAPILLKNEGMPLWNLGTLLVHRGELRKQNRLVVVNINGPDDRALRLPSTIITAPMLRAMVDAFEDNTKIRCFCDAMRRGQIMASLSFNEVQNVLRDSLISSFILEVVFLYQSKATAKNGKNQLFSPLLSNLATNPILRSLMVDAVEQEGLQCKLQTHLSDLFARLEAVTVSKDLQPWWAPLGRKRAFQRCLVEGVERLRKEWQFFLKEELMQKTRLQLYHAEDRYDRNDPEGSKFKQWAILYRIHMTSDEATGESGANLSLVVRRHEEFSMFQKDSNDPGFKGKTPVILESDQVALIESTYRERSKLGVQLGRILENERSSYVVR